MRNACYERLQRCWRHANPIAWFHCNAHTWFYRDTHTGLSNDTHPGFHRNDHPRLNSNAGSGHYNANSRPDGDATFHRNADPASDGYADAKPHGDCNTTLHRNADPASHGYTGAKPHGDCNPHGLRWVWACTGEPWIGRQLRRPFKNRHLNRPILRSDWSYWSQPHRLNRHYGILPNPTQYDPILNVIPDHRAGIRG
ncbi:MAG: hypothetical protein WD533_02055 [Dehalococcoidia bacterium]